MRKLVSLGICLGSMGVGANPLVETREVYSLLTAAKEIRLNGLSSELIARERNYAMWAPSQMRIVEFLSLPRPEISEAQIAQLLDRLPTSFQFQLQSPYGAN